MARSHRNEDRGGERRWTFNGVEYPTRKLMCEARRAEYVRLLDEEGMNFTQAAHAVGVSKRTGKAWRNGRTRATGRNEKPLVDWYRSTMDKPKTLHPRYLSQEERIQIADRLRLGDSIRAIVCLSIRAAPRTGRPLSPPAFADPAPHGQKPEPRGGARSAGIRTRLHAPSSESRLSNGHREGLVAARPEFRPDYLPDFIPYDGLFYNFTTQSFAR